MLSIRLKRILGKDTKWISISWIVFRTVAHMEHISNAAVVLHITQPALSKIITRVEEYAGAPLFDRVKGKIRLNASGTAFWRRWMGCLIRSRRARSR